MSRPDFAYTDVSRLTDRDVRFLVDSFPDPGRTYAEISRAMEELPTTLESMLSNREVVEAVVHERQRLVQVSPFLLFNVLLRQVVPRPRDALERRTLHYLANLLALFVDSRRLVRPTSDDPDSYEYLVDLLEEAGRSAPRRRFLVHAHVGNYSLFMTGIFGRWIEQRHRHGRRLVDSNYYADLGSASFSQASALPTAQEFSLTDLFVRLSLQFDRYRDALERLSDRYLQSER